MRIPAVLTVLLLTLTACGSEGDVTVTDPGPGDSPPPSAVMPAEAPVPAGEVRTRGLATVMDTGTGTPELCLGPVAESYPPQCGGPQIAGWDWTRHGQDMFDRQGDIRWGTFAVTGTWDGTAFTATEAVPGPLYDPAPTEPEPTPAAGASYSTDELEGIRADVEALPGFQGGYAAEGRVHVEVIYDDGSLQAWADQEYGAGVVVVASLLVDA